MQQLEIVTHKLDDIGIRLTYLGETYCMLMKLRVLLTKLSPSDKAEIVEQMHEMLDNLPKAA